MKNVTYIFLRCTKFSVDLENFNEKSYNSHVKLNMFK